ncbi:MAG: hypothetical protein H0U74_10435 [Bradymonadaceae bacterium]|nr:hypothetical protein [Lujinxingiaceae bacterium]
MFLHRSSIFSIALLSAGFVLSAGIDDASAQAKGWASGAKAKAPTMLDLIPRMSSGQSYTERYGFSVDLEGGGHIGVDFTISNLGFGSGYGAAGVRVNVPGAKRYEFSEKMNRGKWSYATDRFFLDIANTSVESKGNDTFVVKHDGDVKFELEFKNTIPMWRPGDGEITVDGGYYKFNLISPRADVTGKVFVNGEWREVKAARGGYADHVATNIAPYDLAKRFSRFRHYNDDVFIIWREIQLEEKFGGETFTWVMVGYRDQIVFADANATIKFGNVRPDASTGYSVPHSLQVEGKNGHDTITLVMRGNKADKRDLLASYGRAARLVASAVSKPFQYTVKSQYTIQMSIKGTTANVAGKTHYTIDFVNP